MIHALLPDAFRIWNCRAWRGVLPKCFWLANGLFLVLHFRTYYIHSQTCYVQKVAVSRTWHYVSVPFSHFFGVTVDGKSFAPVDMVSLPFAPSQPANWREPINWTISMRFCGGQLEMTLTHLSHLRLGRHGNQRSAYIIIKASSTGLICLIAVPLASMENSQVTRHAPYLDIFAEFRAWREKSSVEFLFHVRELGLDTVWKWCSPLGYKLAPERFGVPPKAFCGLGSLWKSSWAGSWLSIAVIQLAVVNLGLGGPWMMGACRRLIHA